MDYEPYNHYWQRDDGSLFSSARGIDVQPDDAVYQAWIADGGVPTSYPKDEQGNESMAELDRILIPYGLRVSPSTEEEKENTARAAANEILLPLAMKALAESASLSDEQLVVIGGAGYLDAWEAGQAYEAGKRLVHEGQVYVVLQKVTAQMHQPPSAGGMLAVYRPVQNGHAGTGTDPIPFVYGMDVENGKYYSFEGKTYLCKSDMVSCVWNPGTAGLWQWELVES